MQLITEVLRSQNNHKKVYKQKISVNINTVKVKQEKQSAKSHSEQLTQAKEELAELKVLTPFQPFSNLFPSKN